MDQEETLIDCRGLSAALTVLRIKQAFIGAPEDVSHVDVVVNYDCDCRRIAASLADKEGDVRFLKTEEDAPPAYVLSMSSAKTMRAHV